MGMTRGIIDVVSSISPSGQERVLRAKCPLDRRMPSTRAAERRSRVYPNVFIPRKESFPPSLMTEEWWWWGWWGGGGWGWGGGISIRARPENVYVAVPSNPPLHPSSD